MSTETVSKTKATTGEEAVTQKESKRKTLTDWKVFTDAGLIPIRFRCDGYKSNHPAELSCHSNFPPSAENVVRHMNPDHGLGVFKIKFRLSDGKTSPLWGELESAGVELQEFYCPHCREQVPVSARRIIYHLKEHPGANRINLEPQSLAMQLGFQRVETNDDDELYLRAGE